MGIQRLHEHLLTRGIAYRPARHRRTVPAQSVAAAAHVSGHDVAKPVMVRAADELVMVVVPASYRVDLDAVERALHTQVRLATEGEFGPVFQDCEVGAEPPFGNLYGLLVLLDRRLAERERMVCRDGSHEETLELSVADFIDVVKPRIVDVAVAEPAVAGAR